MTRADHLEWCKSRARDYLEAGDTKGALASMFSDLGKHAETEGHAAIKLGAMLMMAGHLHTVQQVREFIEGFN